MIIKPHDWEMRISHDITVIRRQIPLVLAYASTIHRAQGMTLDCVELDLGDDIFADGQFYTALSRVRSIKGMSISQLNLQGATMCHPKVKAFYDSLN